MNSNSENTGTESDMDPTIQVLPTSPQLELPKYQWWYDAIVNDRQDVIKHHLRSSSTDYKHQLVNGGFSQLNLDSFGLNDKDKFRLRAISSFLPFHLAIAYGASRETISEFLSHGVDLTIKDHHGNNCIHVMVTMAFLKPHKEDYMKDLYCMISDYLPRTTLKSILLQEDKDGFRPLELAANTGTFGLFLDIFHTRGVYLTRECTKGIYLKQYFDITEYESVTGSRRPQITAHTAGFTGYGFRRPEAHRGDVHQSTCPPVDQIQIQKKLDIFRLVVHFQDDSGHGFHYFRQHPHTHRGTNN